MSYAHIAEFVRNAPQYQLREFWNAVGRQLESHVDEHPRWLSTAGLGVYWLHARVDSRPKYYRHQPYKIYSPH